jgi:4-amino-4-deoxy-L-arabinose transferase-like glycosyltransferase
MRFKTKEIFKDAKTRFLLILFMALLVRLLGIASRPIWYDEAFSILFSEKGLGQMIYGTLAPTGAGSADIHPLGYYTLLWAWMKLFGESLIATRILSVLAGIGIIYLVYKISNELFDTKTAETAALIASFASFQVHYAQEIRMYAFLAFWLLLAVYSYLRGSKSGDWRWWLVFGITSALAQYTHNLAAFFLVPLAFTPLIKRDWKTFRSILISGLLAILLYLPWLIRLPSQFAKVDQSYWVTKPDISRLFTLLLVFTTNIPLPNTWILPALVVALVILALAVMQTVRAAHGINNQRGLWVLYLTFAPPLLLFAFSQWIPVYIERALLPSGVFFCIWLAWTIHNTNLPNIGRGFMFILLTIAFTIGLYQHVTFRGFPYGPFKELTSRLREAVLSDDLILHSNKLSMLPAMYFDRTLPQTFIGDPPGGATDTLAPATQQVLQIEAESDIRFAVNGVNRVWFIIYQQSIDEYVQAGKSTHPDIEYLNSEYTLTSDEHWDDVLLLIYTKTP